MKKRIGVAGLLAAFFLLFAGADGLEEIWSRLRVSVSHAREKRVIIDLVYDDKAITQEYQQFFELLAAETENFPGKEYPGVDRRKYQFWVAEFQNSRDPVDRAIIVLWADSEPAVLIDWRRVSRLKNFGDVEKFVKEAAQKMFLFLDEMHRPEPKEKSPDAIKTASVKNRDDSRFFYAISFSEFIPHMRDKFRKRYILNFELQLF